MNSTRRRVMVLLAAAGMLTGLVVRVVNLDHQTLTHPEFFVPNIHLPDWVKSPPERMTVQAVMSNALFGDRHPPGYYLLMLAWNKTFGTELFAMRLASVLFGMLAVVALPWYARTNGARGALPGAGVLAVWLLSLHGFHVTWSQQLRPWALVGTLGILTTALLPVMVRRPTTRSILAYAALAGLGLWVDYYFWPIFGMQVAWIVLRESKRARMTPALQAILLTCILATPLLIYAWGHIRWQPSHLGSARWLLVLNTLEFGNVLQRGRSIELMAGFAPVFFTLTALLGAIALGLGLKAWPAPDEPVNAREDALSRSLNAVLAAAAVLVVGATWYGFHDLIGDSRAYRLALAGPFLILLSAWIGRVAWPAAANGLMRSRAFRRLRDVLADPVAVIPIGAFTGVTLLGLVAPVLVARTLVVFTPLFVVLAARGMTRMHRLQLPFVAVVLCIFALSTWQYARSPISAREYQGLARQMIPRMKQGETVLTHDNWYAVPINYYLKPGEYRVLPLPQTEAARAELPDTVWVVGYGRPDEIDGSIQEIRQTVPGYTEVERVSTPTSAACKLVRGGKN